MFQHSESIVQQGGGFCSQAKVVFKRFKLAEYMKLQIACIRWGTIILVTLFNDEKLPAIDARLKLFRDA